MEKSARGIPVATSSTLMAALIVAIAWVCYVWKGSYVSLGASFGEVGDVVFQAHGLDAVRFALPLAFSRFSIPASRQETPFARAVLGSLLGFIGVCNLRLRAEGVVYSFAILFGAHVASYVACLGPKARLGGVGMACLAGSGVGLVVAWGHWFWFVRGGLGLAAEVCARKVFLPLLPASSHSFWTSRVVLLCVSVTGAVVLPVALGVVMKFFLPIDEVVEAYEAVAHFVGPEQMGNASMEMFIVTVNIQIALGYLGIAFLLHTQSRQNALLTIGRHEGGLSAHAYMSRTRHWVLAICLPFVLQRAVMTSVHSYSFGRFRHWTERSLRLHCLFPQEGAGGTLLKAVAESSFTVEQYADAINGVVESSFGLVVAKLSALPKLMLLPGVLAAKPWLLAAVLPASVLLDVAKAKFAATLTFHVERLHRELMELANQRRRMELHDMKHGELIQRGHVSEFIQQRWRALGNKIEDRGMQLASLQHLRGLVDTTYQLQLLGPGVDCVLALLMEVGYVSTADIGVYASVIEQSIDTLLTRHREQATLANMKTKVELVIELSGHLERVRAQGRPTCSLDAERVAARVSLEYMRGQSHVRIPDLILPSGRIYAVTGANGCGKSTALALLSTCGQQGGLLPFGVELVGSEASIVLPSDDLVEIAQHFYCPLFTNPMSWLLQGTDASSTGISLDQQAALRKRAEALLFEFGLLRNQSEGAVAKSGFTVQDLDIEKEDWYSELSGGERCKVEFIRKVFLKSKCPGVLLIDEAFAPLDPASKQLIMRRLKVFCSASLVLVVYHGGDVQQCLSGEGFFDDNLHFAEGSARLIGVC